MRWLRLAHLFYLTGYIMKRKKITISLLVLLTTLLTIFGFSSCSNFLNSSSVVPTVSYSWYDADNTLLFSETIEEGKTPSAYALPEDTDKWDYIEWKQGQSENEKIAHRVPQNSYFVGNVFQIVVKNLGQQPIATGSAFVFNSAGWFITNAHVMENAYYAQAVFNIPNEKTGKSFTYFDINKGTYCDIDRDIYIGKIENYKFINSYYKDIALNTNYTIGKTSYSVGYPNSSTQLIVNQGTITEAWSDIYEKLYSGNSYICSSSCIYPGSSGGILTNENLDVIGITTLGWFGEDDEFISGAAISAFNIQAPMKQTNDNALTSLQNRFHKSETKFIDFFNTYRNLNESGKASEYFLNDGTLGYLFEQTDEGVNSNNHAFVYKEQLLVCANTWISYRTEYYWEVGDRRIISFYGYYDHEKGFANFTFEFKYTWSSGDYYTVSSSNINYSPTLSLTLNKYTASSSSSLTPSQSNIDYAKEQFNYIYEWFSTQLG